MASLASGAAAERAGQRLTELARSISNDPEYKEMPWTGITVVVTMLWQPPDFETVEQYFGYSYAGEVINPHLGSTQRWRAKTPTRQGTAPAFVALAKAIAEPDGKEPWKHCLFQLDRESGAVNVEFAYEDTHPWNPDFTDLDAWVERLRPPSGRTSD